MNPHSEPQSAGSLMGPGSILQRFRDRVALRKQWEAENPELAAAWNEALKDDHDWQMRREWEEREKADRVRVEDVLAGMEVPLDVLTALRHLRDEKPLQAAKKFLDEGPDERGRFLLLLGDVGTGKTCAAVWVLREVLVRARARQLPSGGEARRRPVAMFARASTFSRLSAYAQADREWFEDLCLADVTVLDDLAAESLSPIGGAMLDELLDRRYSARRRTVITSNLAPGAFALRVGSRAADRMRHHAIVAETSGKSLRVRQPRVTP